MRTATFLSKLFDYCNDAQNPYFVWSDSGDSFSINVKESGFSDKHGEIASIIRNLNLYGFAKTSPSGSYVYSNANFRRGQPDLISSVTRTTKRKRDFVEFENIINSEPVIPAPSLSGDMMLTQFMNKLQSLENEVKLTKIRLEQLTVENDDLKREMKKLKTVQVNSESTDIVRTEDIMSCSMISSPVSWEF